MWNDLPGTTLLCRHGAGEEPHLPILFPLHALTSLNYTRKAKGERVRERHYSPFHMGLNHLEGILCFFWGWRSHLSSVTSYSGSEGTRIQCLLPDNSLGFFWMGLATMYSSGYMTFGSSYFDNEDKSIDKNCRWDVDIDLKKRLKK